MSPFTYSFALHRVLRGALYPQVCEDYTASGTPTETVTLDPSAKNAEAGPTDNAAANSAP